MTSGILMDDSLMTCKGKHMYRLNNVEDYNIQSESTLRRLKGGANDLQEMEAVFNRMESQMQQMQSALAQEQPNIAEPRQLFDKKHMPGGDSGRIINAIRRGKMRDVTQNTARASRLRATSSRGVVP